MINNPAINSQSKSSLVTFDKCTNNVTELKGEEGKTVISGNPKRLYAALINNSSATITLMLGEPNSGTVERGIILNPYGGCFEITLTNLYRGKVSAICASDVKLSWVECSEQ